MPEHPTLSDYALCEVEDVADLLGFDADDTSKRSRLIIRVINAASRAIPRRGQREFKQTLAEVGQTRYVQIDKADVARGYVRCGDMGAVPDEVKIWTPERDSSVTLDVEEDLWLLPDVPEPGYPFEYVKVKASKATLAVGSWLSVKTDWGFVEPPDDIVMIAIGTAASWIVNDVMKQTELARAAGRRVRFESLIPEEFVKAVEDYRLLRVS